jgi:hypothetical protein
VAFTAAAYEPRHCLRWCVGARSTLAAECMRVGATNAAAPPALHDGAEGEGGGGGGGGGGGDASAAAWRWRTVSAVVRGLAPGDAVSLWLALEPRHAMAVNAAVGVPVARNVSVTRVGSAEAADRAMRGARPQSMAAMRFYFEASEGAAEVQAWM